MKTKLLIRILVLCTSLVSYCQSEPVIKFLTPIKIYGKGLSNAILHVKPNTAHAVININIPATGIIDHSFARGEINAGEDAIIWTTFNNIDSKKIVVHCDNEAAALIALADGTTSITSQKIDKMLADDLLLKNTKITYRRTILTTNFSIPIARFDIYKPEYGAAGNLISDSKGNISLFTSFGAGIGISGGRAIVSRDSKGKIIDEEFSNTLGVYAGILYQAGTGEETKNVFAPTLTLNIMDFQVGVGYEYGKVLANQERTFITISYGLPLYKLFKTNHRVWLDTLGAPVEVEQL